MRLKVYGISLVGAWAMPTRPKRLLKSLGRAVHAPIVYYPERTYGEGATGGLGRGHQPVHKPLEYSFW
jgi:hypothetical protein